VTVRGVLMPVCLVARCVTNAYTIGQAICYSIPLGHCLNTRLLDNLSRRSIAHSMPVWAVFERSEKLVFFFESDVRFA
jgi:hypothetical protein